jgi:erythronate-4-phosphate dehydrogenase
MKIIADANIPFVEECFSSFGDVSAMAAGEITARAVRDADILLVRSVTKVNEALLEGARVKFVASATSGFEHVDTDFVASRQVGFGYAAGSNANSVAEYVIAALLAVAKKHKFQLENRSASSAQATSAARWPPRPAPSAWAFCSTTRLWAGSRTRQNTCRWGSFMIVIL